MDIRNSTCKCWVCGTEYNIQEVLSTFSGLDSDFKPKENICPNCGAPYRHSATPSIGIVRDLYTAIYWVPSNGEVPKLEHFVNSEEGIEDLKKLLLAYKDVLAAVEIFVDMNKTDIQNSSNPALPSGPYLPSPIEEEARLKTEKAMITEMTKDEVAFKEQIENLVSKTKEKLLTEKGKYYKADLQ